MAPSSYSPFRPAVPQSTPNATLPGKVSRRPIQNPYDKFTQPEFDNWIGGLTSALRRALGEEVTQPLEEDLPPRAEKPIPAPKLTSSTDATRAALSDTEEDYGFEAEEDEEVNIEDSFAEVKARRAKGKARDPREGPGLGAGVRPIEILSDDDNDEGRIVADEEDEQEEDAFHGSDILAESNVGSDEVEEVAPTGSRIQTSKDDEIISLDSGDDEDEEHGTNDPRISRRLASKEDGYHEGSNDINDEGAVIDEVTEEPESLEVEGHGHSRAESAKAVYRDPDIIFYTENGVIEDPSESSQPLILPNVWQGPETYAEDFYSGGDIREGVFAQEDITPSQLTPVHDQVVDTEEPCSNSPVFDVDALILPGNNYVIDPQLQEYHEVFPPPRPLGPLPQLGDPWQGPQTFAKDFYSGGDILEGSIDLDVSPSHLTPVHEAALDNHDSSLQYSYPVESQEDEQEMALPPSSPPESSPIESKATGINSQQTDGEGSVSGQNSFSSGHLDWNWPPAFPSGKLTSASGHLATPPNDDEILEVKDDSDVEDIEGPLPLGTSELGFENEPDVIRHEGSTKEDEDLFALAAEAGDSGNSTDPETSNEPETDFGELPGTPADPIHLSAEQVDDAFHIINDDVFGEVDDAGVTTDAGEPGGAPTPTSDKRNPLQGYEEPRTPVINIMSNIDPDSLPDPVKIDTNYAIEEVQSEIDPHHAPHETDPMDIMSVTSELPVELSAELPVEPIPYVVDETPMEELETGLLGDKADTLEPPVHLREYLPGVVQALTLENVSNIDLKDIPDGMEKVTDSAVEEYVSETSQPPDGKEDGAVYLKGNDFLEIVSVAEEVPAESIPCIVEELEGWLTEEFYHPPSIPDIVVSVDMADADAPPQEQIDQFSEGDDDRRLLVPTISLNDDTQAQVDDEPDEQPPLPESTTEADQPVPKPVSADPDFHDPTSRPITPASDIAGVPPSHTITGPSSLGMPVAAVMSVDADAPKSTRSQPGTPQKEYIDLFTPGGSYPASASTSVAASEVGDKIIANGGTGPTTPAPEVPEAASASDLGSEAPVQVASSSKATLPLPSEPITDVHEPVLPQSNGRHAEKVGHALKTNGDAEEEGKADISERASSEETHSSKEKRQSSMPAPLRLTRSMTAKGKDKEPSQPDIKRSANKRKRTSATGTESGNTSGSSVSVTRILAGRSRTNSRASTAVSDTSNESFVSQPSPLFAKPVPPLFHTHSHINHHHRHQLPFSESVDTVRKPAPPSSAASVDSEAEATAPQPGPSRKAPVVSHSPVTRSNCRFHKISLPHEEFGPRVHFIVPGCSISNMELMQEQDITDHGDANPEDLIHIMDDVESLDLSSYLVGILRQLVGVDLLRENEVFYLPTEGDGCKRKRRRKLAKMNTFTKKASLESSSRVDHSSFAGSPRTSRLSPTSSLSQGPTSAASAARFSPAASSPLASGQSSISTRSRSSSDAAGRTASNIASNDTSVPSNQMQLADDVESTNPAESAYGKKQSRNDKRSRRRSKRMSIDASAYKPDPETEEVDTAGEEEGNKKGRRRRNAKKGVKRPRNTENDENGVGGDQGDGDEGTRKTKKARV